VNQVEYHPYLNQESLLEECKKNKIALTAYSPLARGDIINDKVLKSVAEKYDKTTSQIALRWLLQKNIIVIPKASSENHLKENLNIFDFELKKEDLEKINKINVRKRLVNPGFSEFED
jgi:diketogulonate reductase-like aldo/keto reductase